MWALSKPGFQRTRRFHGDPNVIGEPVSLNGKPYTVIGVLPEWFIWPNTKVQMWTPVYHEENSEQMHSHISHGFNAVARLKPGVTVQEARIDLSTVQQKIHDAIGDAAINRAANVLPIVYSETHTIRTALFILLGATGCLLLIPCLNVANLLVARATARQKEAAIRAVLGGSRVQRLRTQLIESLLLCAAGGLLGLALASGAVRWLVSVRQDIPRADSIHLDGAVLLFLLGVVLLSGLLSGVLPILTSDDSRILDGLQKSSRSHSESASRVRMRRALMTLEMSLTVVLLIAAGLLIKSYNRLRSVDIGCTTSNILTMDLYLPLGRYSTRTQIVNFYATIAQQVSRLPGVEGVGLVSTGLPGTGFHGDDGFSIAEDPALPRGQMIAASIRYVDPDFFRAMQIPLVRGRVFLPSERLEPAQFAVVNEAFVRRFFPNRNPIGKRILDNNDGPKNRYEIIGIVGDTLETVSEAPKPTVYYPLYRGGKPYVYVAVRSRQDPSSLVLPIQQIAAGLDRDLPLADVMTMDQLTGEQTLEQSFNARLLVAFAAISLLLACVGLFGVLSYIVSQRTTEIGIRIALGARREQVLWLMLNDGVRPAVIGLVLGLIASAGTSHLIQSLLYGTYPLDPGYSDASADSYAGMFDSRFACIAFGPNGSIEVRVIIQVRPVGDREYTGKMPSFWIRAKNRGAQTGGQMGTTLVTN